MGAIEVKINVLDQFMFTLNYWILNNFFLFLSTVL